MTLVIRGVRARVGALTLLIAAGPGSGCGARTVEGVAVEVGGASRDDSAVTESHRQRARAFAAVARVDRRLARRLGMKPQGTEVLFPENRAPAELSALFEFDARAKVLLEQRTRAGTDRALARLLGEEIARVETERDLPRGASAIVRTLALDLPIDDTHEEDLRSEDEALVATLDRLRGTLHDGALGALQLAELDDSLDPFEKRTTRLVGTPGAIARLRVALTSLKAAPKESIAPWEVTRPRVEVFVGSLSSASELARNLEAAHAVLAPHIASALPKERSDRERVTSAAAEMLLSSARQCPEAGVADVQAPIERRGLCSVLGALSKHDVVALIAADVALDLARWALAIHYERVDVAKAFANKRTHVPVDEGDGAHLFRFALGHPIEAISLGLAAAMVAREPQKLAAAWLATGPLRPDEARAVFGPGLM